MDFLGSAILGVIEGLSEFLPISSTAHLVFATRLLNIAQSDFTKTFEIVIQSGAILAVVVLYGKKLLVDRKILQKVLFAFLPTAILGFIFYKIIKQLLLGNILISLFALLIGGFIIIFAEKYFEKKKNNRTIEQLNNRQAFLVGVAQSIAVIPGVSRSAATILGSMFFGLSRKEAVEFSFMLAIPTMFAATGYDLLKNIKLLTSSNLELLLVGFVISFITAIIAVKWFLKFVQTNTLIPFAIYRIAIALILYLVLLRA